MIKRVGNGLLYDDTNDNIGHLLGSIIGERIVDTQAKALAKKQQEAYDAQQADAWNTEHASEIAESNNDKFMNLAGFGGYDTSIDDDGQLNVQQLPSDVSDYKDSATKSAFNVADFMNKFNLNASNAGVGFNPQYNMRKIFQNRNNGRLPNAFSRLS